VSGPWAAAMFAHLSLFLVWQMAAAIEELLTKKNKEENKNQFSCLSLAGLCLHFELGCFSIC